MVEGRIIKASKVFSDCMAITSGKSLSEMSYQDVLSIKNNLRIILHLLDETEIFSEQKKQASTKIIRFFNNKFPLWKADSKQRESIIPRQILQSILYDKTDLTLKEIGVLTGGYKHENIIYSTNVVNEMLETDNQEYCAIYNYAISEINKMK